MCAELREFYNTFVKDVYNSELTNLAENTLVEWHNAKGDDKAFALKKLRIIAKERSDRCDE